MEKDIFYLTKYLLSYICDEFHEKDLRNGINSYYSMSCGLILNMNKNNEKVIQKDLQDELLTPKSVTSELVSKMINDGLIYKEKDELDKRKDNLYLTNKGKEFAVSNLKLENDVQNEILSLFDTEEEKENFYNLYSKLINKIKEKKRNEKKDK